MGWAVGQNIQIDYRWSEGNPDDIRRHAAELVARAPDVIFAPGSAAVAPLRQATRTIPIVFPLAPDPVGSGLVNSLARPGGNVTGFASYDYGIGAKWLELLKELAPNVTRAAVLRDPNIVAGMGQWGAVQSMSPSVGIEVTPVNMDDAGEIERTAAAFGRNPNGGLILITGKRCWRLLTQWVVNGRAWRGPPLSASPVWTTMKRLPSCCSRICKRCSRSVVMSFPASSWRRTWARWRIGPGRSSSMASQSRRKTSPA